MPITFTGKELTLNFATSAAGGIRVEIQDELGRALKGYALADAVETIGNEIERLAPIRFHQLAATPAIGPVEPTAHQPVNREPGLVADPLLVDVLVQARQHAQDLRAAGIDPDVAAHRVENIDRFGFAQFPGPRDIGIGFRG